MGGERIRWETRTPLPTTAAPVRLMDTSQLPLPPPRCTQGVRGILVISAGFGEAGPDGAARQAELIAIASEYHMRVVGPNSLGFLTADPSIRLNVTFVDTCAPLHSC